MAKTKAELLQLAKEQGIEVDKSSTIAVLKEQIDKAQTDLKPSQEQAAVDLTEEDSEEQVLAKAGKRSAKAIKEAETLKAKQVRKASNQEDSQAPKKLQKPTRSRLERRAKGYKTSAAKIEVGKSYTIDEAIELAKTTSHVKFDASVELHFNLNVDPKQADQNIRDNINLPAGSGKNVRVAVMSEDSKAALAAGADIAGNDDFLQLLDKGKLDFDILIATPSLMAKLGKYARVLGPRGLMPNPKSGTVTNDIDRAVKESKTGKVEYRVDPNGIVHLAVGKVSFSNQNLSDNIMSVVASIKSNKPQSVKSGYIKSIYLATSMGPSIAVDVASLG